MTSACTGVRVVTRTGSPSSSAAMRNPSRITRRTAKDQMAGRSGWLFWPALDAVPHTINVFTPGCPAGSQIGDSLERWIKV